MAELADVIPYHAGRGWYVPHNPRQVWDDEGYAELLEREKVYEQIVGGCMECIAQTGAEYIVVNKEVLNVPLQKEIVHQSGNFIVYLN